MWPGRLSLSGHGTVDHGVGSPEAGKEGGVIRFALGMVVKLIDFILNKFYAEEETQEIERRVKK